MVHAARKKADADVQLDVRTFEDDYLPYDEAAASAKMIWTHLNLAGCLIPDKESSHDLAQKVWELELNHTVQKALKNSLFSSISNKVLSLFTTKSKNKEKLHEAEEQMMMEWKHTLKVEYDFDYDTIKQTCILDLEPQFNRTLEMAEQEFSGGCSGGCSKKSIVSSGECRETLETKFCPEGTQCGCNFETSKILGPVVGVVTSAIYTGVSVLIAGPAGVAVPGKVAVGMFAMAIAGSKATGCRCLPSDCSWNKDREACVPTSAKGAKNPFQAVLPYVGMKCIAKTKDWRAKFGRTYVSPGCKDAMPCAPEDFNKMGQIGTDTFNCKYLGEASNASTLFPPLEERVAEYKKLSLV